MDWHRHIIDSLLKDSSKEELKEEKKTPIKNILEKSEVEIILEKIGELDAQKLSISLEKMAMMLHYSKADFELDINEKIIRAILK